MDEVHVPLFQIRMAVDMAPQTSWHPPPVDGQLNIKRRFPGEQGAAGFRMLLKQQCLVESRQFCLRHRTTQSGAMKFSKETETRSAVILATDPNVPDTRQQKLCNMYLLFPLRPWWRVIHTDYSEGLSHALGGKTQCQWVLKHAAWAIVQRRVKSSGSIWELLHVGWCSIAVPPQIYLFDYSNTPIFDNHLLSSYVI